MAELTRPSASRELTLPQYGLDSDLARELSSFTSDPQQLRSCSWEPINCTRQLTPGGYWIDREGQMFQIPRSHVESIHALPDSVKEAFNKAELRQSGPLAKSDYLREAFIVASGFVRFRINSGNISSQSIYWYIDLTRPIRQSSAQDDAILRLTRLKNTTTGAYTVDPTGKTCIKCIEREDAPTSPIQAAGIEIITTVVADREGYEARNAVANWVKDSPEGRRALKSRRSGD